MADNFVGKEERKIRAINWVGYIKSKYSNEIQNSIAGSKVFDGNLISADMNFDDCTVPVVDLETNINMISVEALNGHMILAPEDTISAVLHLNFFNQKNNIPNARIAVLNFASFKHPGGMFMSGSRAQEECICHESTLYPVLKANKQYYADNIAMLSGSSRTDTLYADRLLYSPDIVIEREDYRAVADVITCAAPNLRNISITGQSQFNIIYNRAILILKAARLYGVKEIVLGAWGCGVFRCDPKIVADAFISAINLLKYDMLYVFAIPFDIDQGNYLVFKNELSHFDYKRGY